MPVGEFRKGRAYQIYASFRAKPSEARISITRSGRPQVSTVPTVDLWKEKDRTECTGGTKQGEQRTDAYTKLRSVWLNICPNRFAPSRYEPYAEASDMMAGDLSYGKEEDIASDLKVATSLMLWNGDGRMCNGHHRCCVRAEKRRKNRELPEEETPPR